MARNRSAGGGGRLRARRLLIVGLLVVMATAAAAPHSAAATSAGTSSNFTLVGHNSLHDRGVNAAGAIYGNYEYVGSRSDGTHLNSGVQIVDITDPTNPQDVGQIPLPTDLPSGYTSRELRVWPQQQLLMVVYFACSAILHACASGSDPAGTQPLQRINFFDVGGANGAAPVLVSTYKPSTTPHELFLWTDPVRPSRALLYFTSPNNSTNSLVVTDISDWRHSNFVQKATFSVVSMFSATDKLNYDVRLHSISVSPDGTRTYFAHLGGGVLVVDSTDLANNVVAPQLHLITPIAGRAFWDNQGAHSAVKIPGKPYILATEEIYGKAVVLSDAFGPALGGCPWGWARVIDISDPTNLRIVAEYKIDENQAAFCAALDPNGTQENLSSYASHNPTVLPDVAFLTWHSGGLQAIDLTDPTHPSQDGFFLPTPAVAQTGEVHTQDPVLEPGSNGVIGWSYPIIRNGLIYYIDVANGLYIVRYTGPHAAEAAGVTFLEGNSSLGDAARLEAGPGTTVPEARMTWPLLALGGLVILAAVVLGGRRRQRRVT